MNCPSCGAADDQERLGQLGDQPHVVVYHCLSCGNIYARPEGDDGADAGDD